MLSPCCLVSVIGSVLENALVKFHPFSFILIIVDFHSRWCELCILNMMCFKYDLEKIKYTLGKISVFL